VRSYLIAIPTALASLAISAAGPGPALADAALYGEHCAKCHARAATLARSLKGGTIAEKSAALDKLLSGHHAPDPEVRSRIVAYLLGLAGK
jgi:mono/diheme cytochrome c family protein